VRISRQRTMQTVLEDFFASLRAARSGSCLCGAAYANR
jgi:hypothetical protein